MVKKVMLIAVSLVVLLGGFLYYSIDKKLDNMELDTDNIIVDDEYSSQLAQTTNPQIITSDKEEDAEDFYTLLIGLDQREKLIMLNTDSLIVAHIIPQTATIKLISIPRDQRVINGKGDPTKINSIFASGYQTAVKAARKNPELLSGKQVSIGDINIHEEYISSGVTALRNTIEQHLGVPISYSFIVSFNSVVELVDEVGGIEINVDRSMHYDAEFDGTSIHLEKGLQILDGRNALNYSRHRKDIRGAAYESSDFDRGRRQQEVITALVKEIVGWGSVTKAMGLLDIVTSNVLTDMKRTKMVSLITDFYGELDSESVISLPYPGEWISPYVEVKEEAFEQTLEQFKSTQRFLSTEPTTS